MRSHWRSSIELVFYRRHQHGHANHNLNQPHFVRRNGNERHGFGHRRRRAEDSSITVSPRSGWAFTEASAVQQSNPFTDPCSIVLSADNPPVAPVAGGAETIGASDACQNSAYVAAPQIDSGSNSGYIFFTSATNVTQFNWVGAQDILNPSSVFYGKQCGNYNPITNVGFISGANLSLNLIRHESSAVPGQGHYGNYIAAQNLPSLNVGTAYESIVVFNYVAT